MIAVGSAALAASGIGAHIQFPTHAARWLTRAATFECAVYAGLAMFEAQTFAIAVLNHSPAASILLLVFVLAHLRLRDEAVLLGAAGMPLSFVAAGVQQAGMALHPSYLTPSAFYHLIQGASLFLVFASGRPFAGRRPC